MARTKYDYQFKILLIGDSCVGKTSLLRRFADNVFDNNFIATVGIDFKIKTIEVGDKRVRLQVWDTAGQERFHTICASFYRDANAIILVYDITNSSSFDNIGKWLRNIDERITENVLKSIVGNKCDLEDQRIIFKERGEEIAELNNVPFYETSAKTNTNINKIFNDMTKRLVDEEMQKDKSKNVNIETPSSIDLNKPTTSQSSQTSCCWYSR